MTKNSLRTIMDEYALILTTTFFTTYIILNEYGLPGLYLIWVFVAFTLFFIAFIYIVLKTYILKKKKAIVLFLSIIPLSMAFMWGLDTLVPEPYRIISFIAILFNVWTLGTIQLMGKEIRAINIYAELLQNRDEERKELDTTEGGLDEGKD